MKPPSFLVSAGTLAISTAFLVVGSKRLTRLHETNAPPYIHRELQAPLGESDTGSNRRPFTIVHVVNPFPVSNCDEMFCPFDQQQNVALASMMRAKMNTEISVLLAAAVLAQDESVVPQEFFQLPHLTRSTASQYPHLLPPKNLPFVQDVFDGVLSSGVDFEYMIYSNSDIILGDHFYDFVMEKINEGWESFTINRRTVPSKKKDKTPYTKFDYEEIFSLEGDPHPGSDCFIIKKSVLEVLQMGDAFLGFGPWGTALKFQLRLSSNFTTFRSKNRVTFHLGNERKWMHDDTKDYQKQNWDNVYNAKRLWCLCPEDMKDKMCRTLYGNFQRNGYDMSNACPQSLQSL